MIQRRIYQSLWEILSQDNKMVLISGPRQSGKTTFAKSIASQFANQLYFNWDTLSDKKRFVRNPAFFQEMERKDSSIPLVIYDEIHKYKLWKNYLKGIYDEFSRDYRFLITGSGRLDLLQKGGDALSGRYFPMNLFPLSIAELSNKNRPHKEFLKNPLQNFDLNSEGESSDYWKHLFQFGPYPEPFLKGSQDFLIRWSDTMTKQIIREDIRTFFDIKQVDSLELLTSLLPAKIGSPFSLSNVANDLQVSFDTIKSWIRILEAFYLVFLVGTWTKKISRSILKEKKIYLMNYTDVDDPALRYENMVAFELYKAIAVWNHAGLGKFGLHYLRNKEKEEVDFLISEKNEPFLLIEAKACDVDASKSLLYYQNILKIPAVQLVNKEGTHRFIKNGPHPLLIISAHRWLSSLPGIL